MIYITRSVCRQYSAVSTDTPIVSSHVPPSINSSAHNQLVSYRPHHSWPPRRAEPNQAQAVELFTPSTFVPDRYIVHQPVCMIILTSPKAAVIEVVNYTVVGIGHLLQ